MPLFRFHRGLLAESLKTTIIVENLNDIIKAIFLSNEVIGLNNKPEWAVKFDVRPYPSEDRCFDARIGWYTQLVTANLDEEDRMDVIGFLSEPLKIY